MKIIKTADLPSLVGTEIGVTDWMEIDQERVNVFADVTDDHQFIHVDPDKAKMSAFGGPIAHGFLTLSLLSKFAETAGFAIEGAQMGLNYGFEKIRFLAPVKVGQKIRGRFTLQSIDEKRPGQYLFTYGVIVEIDGEDKPALVADWMGMQFVE
ncbi:MAG: MaoC family dehydratase [Litorimonas sp.]